MPTPHHNNNPPTTQLPTLPLRLRTRPSRHHCCLLIQCWPGPHHIYTHANQQGRAEYKYYGALAVCALFTWDLLLKEQEVAALRMAENVMDWLKEMRLLDWFAFDEQIRLV